MDSKVSPSKLFKGKIYHFTGEYVEHISFDKDIISKKVKAPIYKSNDGDTMVDLDQGLEYSKETNGNHRQQIRQVSKRDKLRDIETLYRMEGCKSAKLNKVLDGFLD